MVYGQEQLIQLPTLSLYDTQIMAMALNAAKDMYDRNEQQLKDFYNTYGDFLTPIAADQAWWDENMSGAARRKVNEIYARGGDPLRNRADMAELQAFVNSRPYAEAALMKQSAENSKLYQKARMELEAKGLYNPLMAKYDGPDLSTYSTADSGVWDKMSPTPFENVATFSNPYFEGMKPNVHKESKNGIDYDVEQITDEDLKAIADAHHNELVSTPQGQIMYKYYQDVARTNGSTDVDKDARDMFNAAIADSQHRRTYRKDSYNDNYYKAEDLKLKRSSNALAWQKFYWDKDKEQQELNIKAAAARGDNGGEGTQESGFSLAQRWYDSGLANFLSSDGITKNWWDMAGSYADNASQIYDKAMKFGNNFTSSKPTTDDLMKYYDDERTAGAVRNAINTPENKRTEHQKKLVKIVEDRYYKDHSKHYNTDEVRQAFKRQYTIGMDTKSVAGAIGDTVSGNDRVVQATAANIDKLFGENDIITNTAGYRRKYEGDDTKEIRDMINQYGASNTTITPLGDGYASLRKSGNFTVMPRVRVTITDDNGNPVYTKDAYYDIGLSSMPNKQGAYAGGARKRGGTIQYGSAVNPAIGPQIGYGYKGPVQLGESTAIFNVSPDWYEGDFQIYPDYNRWTEYGGWDTRESSNLKASPTQKLGTY